MFTKLKKKLKEWTSKVSEIEEEVQEEILEQEEENSTTKTEKPKEESLTTQPAEEGGRPAIAGSRASSVSDAVVGTSEKIQKEESEEQSKEEKERAEEQSKEKKSFLKKIFSKKEKEKETEEESLTTASEKPVKDGQVGTPKKTEQKQIDDETIDKTLKEEVQKKEYKEPEKKFEIGTQSMQPDIEKIEEDKPKEEIKDDSSILQQEDSSGGGVGSQQNTQKTPKKNLFKKLLSSKKTISEEQFDNYAEDLEMILLENNVALEVADKILAKLKAAIIGQELSKKEIENKISECLKEIIEEVLIESFDILQEIKEKEGPYIMIFCGINGVGKTTSIAKFAHKLKEQGITSVMAAGDTFRAAAIEQLKKHGEKLDIKVISHEYGSDPAAVGFDAIKYAKKNNIDVVLIDTAGRIHTATNLLKEMEKIKRVCNPDRTIFLGEAITGNDSVDQVKAFNENIGIDGIILSKADIDEKGGTALSVGYVTEKPILFLGTGQEYEDIEMFDKKKFIEKLGL